MFWQELQAEWQRVKWIVAVLACYVAIGIGYLSAIGVFTPALYSIYVVSLVPFYFVSLPMAVLLWLIIVGMVHTPQDPGIHLRACLTKQNLARFLVGYALLWLCVPFIGTFTQIKISLSANGFASEQTIAHAEAWLHGGIDPSEWLAEHLGGLGLQLFELNYDLAWQWYNLFFLSVVTLHPRLHHVRNFYYLFYFGGVVLLGNVLAGWFISAGPAFYAQVTGDAERFATLKQMLLAGNDHAHAAQRFQDYLWQAREQGRAAFGTGISAFPSVHIFIVACNGLFIRRYLHRVWGNVAMLYALVVLFSSAYLGWHYLIDGYMAIAFAVMVFYALAPRLAPAR